MSATGLQTRRDDPHRPAPVRVGAQAPAERSEANPARAVALRCQEARRRYLEASLPFIPRLLGCIDRNPLSPSYGCFDRQYWHYRTADFASEMYQEAVLPLALVWARAFPGNRWYQQPRLRELLVAALRFSARNGHRDGSCDDYYPFERALGAAVFSLAAGVRAHALVGTDDDVVIAGFERRAAWLIRHDETGRLANHQALAAWALLQVSEATGQPRYRTAADARIERLLAWQSVEGWFDEYGGADPGYQTLTIDCLAAYRRRTGDSGLDEPLARAVRFCRLFLHPDRSFAGPYGSRGTHHFFPRGMELLAAENAQAADLADGFLDCLAYGRQGWFDDDRLVAHRLGNLIEAYEAWSPRRPPADPADDRPATIHLPQAGLLVHRTTRSTTVVSAARGGVFRHFAGSTAAATDTGILVELADGRLASSQWHDRRRSIAFDQEPDFNASAPARLPEAGKDRAARPLPTGGQPPRLSLTITAPLELVRFELATPAKSIVLRLLMLTLGRFTRTAIRWILQRRLITARHPIAATLQRRFEFPPHDAQVEDRLRVVDTIRLADPRLQVSRLRTTTDLEAAYVAVAGVFQESALEPWTDLDDHVAQLNQLRSLTVVREFPVAAGRS